jgi:hypothetical protein
LVAGSVKDTNMTRTNDFATRLTAFAAALVLAAVSTLASVGPAALNLPVA